MSSATAAAAAAAPVRSPVAVDACPCRLPTHTRGGSRQVLAAPLVVRVRGAHISGLSGLEEATGKNISPLFPQQHVFAACQSWQAGRLLGVHFLLGQAPCSAWSRGLGV